MFLLLSASDTITRRRRVLATGGATQKVAIAVSVVAALIAAPSVASARSTADQAREALIRAHLTPTPLYPAILPFLYGDNTATFTHGHFFVWQGHSNTSPGWFSINYRCRCHRGKNYLISVVFSRGPASDIAKAINLSRNIQGHPVRRGRIDGRLRYRFETDKWFGYMWKQQGFAYSVLARYSPRIGWGFVRRFVDLLYPLGRLWTGRTSQGRMVSLYRSRGGVDWGVDYTETCADGSTVDVNDEQLTGVKPDGTFVDLYSHYYTADGGTLLHETFAIRGRFPASTRAPVIGSAADHDVSVRHPRDPTQDCSARFTWEANPI